MSETEEAEEYAVLLRENHLPAETCARDDVLDRVYAKKPSLLIIELNLLPRNPKQVFHPLRPLIYNSDGQKDLPDAPCVMALADRGGLPIVFDSLDSHYAPYDMCLTHPVEDKELLRLLQRIFPTDRK